MTEAEANLYLKDNEDEIFTKKIHGDAVYAAVVIDKNKPFNYIIEIGMRKKTDIFIDLIINGENDKLKNYGFTDRLIEKLKILNTSGISSIDSIFESSDLSNTLTDYEYEFLKFEQQTINELSKENLLNLGYSENEINGFREGSTYEIDSGEISVLGDNKCCDNINCNCYCAFKGNPYKKRQKYIEGGISISEKPSTQSGTLACVFKMDESSRFYGLSNAHVLDEFNQGNTDIIHPGQADAQTNNSHSIIGKTIWTQFGNFLDAGIFEFKQNIDFGNYLNNDPVNLKYPITAYPGLCVQKVGRTSRHTSGEVKSSNTVIEIKNSNGKPLRFYNQIMTTPMAIHGDSGSLLISKSQHACGLLFGINSKKTRNFANHFYMIFDSKFNGGNQNIAFNRFINFKTK